MKTLKTTLHCGIVASFAIFTFAFLAVLLVPDAFAGYKGPTSSAFVKSNVKTALQAKDNTQMALEGYIKNHIRKDKYSFQDNSGSMVVEIDKEDFLEIHVDENTFVRISGEVDKDFSKVEFEVDFLEVIDASAQSKVQ